MLLVAPPSWRPTLRQGERSPPRPPDQQASVEPPGRDARATNGSENAEAQARQAALPEGGRRYKWRPPDRWWNRDSV
ncbi:MAG TPA: hypothetical protein VH599_07780 [Ktedonobacterales bacterium]